eukprot:TRINITY_DN14593_c0_g1_i1.p2 TRINITY_DN14593_c0_g1~~TRINITY_DN14593_c0_g1_i1.p2  ORF type:complete len:144 (-),score=16.72 TRINITY_DN14593_c0_g1_i1:36-467(-)
MTRRDSCVSAGQTHSFTETMSAREVAVEVGGWIVCVGEHLVPPDAIARHRGGETRLLARRTRPQRVRVASFPAGASSAVHAKQSSSSSGQGNAPEGAYSEPRQRRRGARYTHDRQPLPGTMHDLCRETAGPAATTIVDCCRCV